MTRHPQHRTDTPRRTRLHRPSAAGFRRQFDPVARYLCVGADGTVHYFLPAP